MEKQPSDLSQSCAQSSMYSTALCKHNQIVYCVNPKYSDRHALANHAGPDQLQNVVSDLCLHCLPLIQQFLDSPIGFNPF